MKSPVRYSIRGNVFNSPFRIDFDRFVYGVRVHGIAWMGLWFYECNAFDASSIVMIVFLYINYLNVCVWAHADFFFNLYAN